MLRHEAEWDKVRILYPKYERPKYYGFRQSDAPVVLRTIDSKDINFVSQVERTLEEAGLFDVLNSSMKRQGVGKEDFIIGIKPNWMMALMKQEPHVSTNPQLVKAVIEILKAKGFNPDNIFAFESDNMYGNFVENHNVENVATKLHGLDPMEMNVVNLTEDAKENGVDLMPTRKMGLWPTAPFLAKLNFLINISKLKTHPSSGITAAYKGMHGSQYPQNKFCDLHSNAFFRWFSYKARFWFDATFELSVNPALEYTKDMFAIVDAETGMDSLGGWKSLYLYFAGKELKSPFTGEPVRWSELHHPGKLIASSDPFKLELATMLMMNYTPDQLMINPFMRLMAHVVNGLPSRIEIVDNGKKELTPFHGFKTTGNFKPLLSSLFGHRFASYLSRNNELASRVVSFILTIGEGIYPFANTMGILFSGTDPDFPLKLSMGYFGELFKESWEIWLKRGVLDEIGYRRDPLNYIPRLPGVYRELGKGDKDR
jgi:uncharacterized protein (DUF362 family)